MNGSKPSELVTAPASVESQLQSTSRTDTRLARSPFRRLAASYARFLDGLVELLKIPAPETRQVLHRILLMEREIVLPIKAVGIAMLLQFFYFSSGLAIRPAPSRCRSNIHVRFFWFYISAIFSWPGCCWPIVVSNRT